MDTYFHSNTHVRSFFKSITSESMGCDHPNKVADAISDAILDACLAKDPESRVGCETLVKGNQVILAGEITAKVKPDYEQIVCDTVRSIGYPEPPGTGRSCSPPPSQVSSRLIIPDDSNRCSRRSSGLFLRAKARQTASREFLPGHPTKYPPVSDARSAGGYLRKHEGGLRGSPSRRRAPQRGRVAGGLCPRRAAPARAHAGRGRRRAA